MPAPELILETVNSSLCGVFVIDSDVSPRSGNFKNEKKIIRTY